MSAWRRKLVVLFPEHSRDIENNFSIYEFYFDFLPLTHEAHEKNDKEFLEKIYGFSEWCSNQKSKELWNPAAVAFYEHLFDIKKVYWQEIIPWLSDKVIEKHKILWEVRLDDEQFIELVKLLNKRSNSIQLSFLNANVFTTGFIFTI